MSAPRNFAEWMSQHRADDHRHGRLVYHYHPRSDFHSRQLWEFVVADLLKACPKLAEHARAGRVVGGVNAEYTFASGKRKKLDLAIGAPAGMVAPPTPLAPILMADIGELRISIEAKQCMTEHSKSKPRIFDELSSSHKIVHKGVPNVSARSGLHGPSARRFFGRLFIHAFGVPAKSESSSERRVPHAALARVVVDLDREAGQRTRRLDRRSRGRSHSRPLLSSAIR